MPSVSIHRPTVVRNGERTKTAVWWAAWREPGTGKLRRQSTGARDKSVARQIARELERRLLLEPWGITPKQRKLITWADLQKEFLASVASSNRAGTAEAYGYSLTHFGKLAKGLHAHEITTATLDAFVAARRKDGVKPPTINKDLRAIRICLNWAVERDYIPQCPRFKNVLVREDKKQPVVLPADTQQAVFAALDKPDLPLKIRPAAWWKVFLSLISELGVRRGEALGLTWGAVDFGQAEVSVHAETSKGRRDRTLPLGAKLAAVLSAWRELQGSPDAAELVLPWERKTYREFYSDWKVIMKAAGLPKGTKVVPKYFRSTCGSELIAAGVPTVVVKDWLGHSTVVTTEAAYINTSGSLRAAAAQREATRESKTDSPAASP
ncbi:MAG: site-specific integrase [Pirellulaceae bacterium]